MIHTKVVLVASLAFCTGITSAACAGQGTPDIPGPTASDNSKNGGGADNGSGGSGAGSGDDTGPTGGGSGPGVGGGGGVDSGSGKGGGGVDSGSGKGGGGADAGGGNDGGVDAGGSNNADSGGTTCASTTSAADCQNCCEQQHPAGAQTYYGALDNCACGTPGTCARQCAASECAQTQVAPTPGDACDTCLQGATSCDSAAQQACQGDSDCTAMMQCGTTSQCASKP